MLTKTSNHEIFLAKEAKRFKIKIGVFLLLIIKKQVLLLRRFGTGIEDGFYVVPMGGLEEGESPLQTLLRESREEANIQISAKDSILSHVMFRKHMQPNGYVFYQQDLFFINSTFKGEVKNLEPHKADDLRFFDLNDLPKNTSPFIVQALKCALNGEMYSEFGLND